MACIVRVLVLSVVGLCSCSPPEEIGYYSSGEIEDRVPITSEGRFEGTYTRFYPSGQKQAELPYSNNHINGLVKRYSPSGELLSTAVYKNGHQAGEVKGYYRTGELRSWGEIYQGVPQGPMRYYYRSGKLQHFRLYDTRGKVADLAEFTLEGDIDERYTQPRIYTDDDTISAGQDIHFEVILASQSAEVVEVRVAKSPLHLDSVVGKFSSYRYGIKSPPPGKLCVSGCILQEQVRKHTRTTTLFPWQHCFYVTKQR